MITLDQIRKIHKRSIEIDQELNPDDYAPGERYIAILEIMLEYKLDDENSVFQNAAIAMQTIVAQHPFVNGNKRTGLATAMVILAGEDWKLVAPEQEIVDFTVAVATPEKKVSLEQIKTWLEKNVQKR